MLLQCDASYEYPEASSEPKAPDLACAEADEKHWMEQRYLDRDLVAD
jgi:hypothetical protein